MAASGSCGTSETSVSDLLAREDDRPARPAALDRRVGDWASRDSVHAAQAAAESYSSPSESEGDGAGNPQLLQLRLQVATDRAAQQQARIRLLEGELRELRAHAGAGSAASDAARQAQEVLVQRVRELEGALAASRQAEQDKAAALARLEGRTAVAEGSLKASEEQLGKGLEELRARHAVELAAAQEQHAAALAAAQREAAEAAAAAAAAAQERVQQLAASSASLEASLKRERERTRELQGQLENEGCRQEAVRELMRHSEALQAQVDRLQATAADERRRAAKAAQAAEAVIAQERAAADAAAAAAQQRQQEAGREHDKVLRATRAKLQRAEAEARAAKAQAAEAAGRAAELEASNAQKDLQLDAAVQQVTLMQHELEALRQGLSGRQAAALEAARGEFAAALAGCQAELEASRKQASEAGLAASRQSAALSTILHILAVHAGEEGGVGCNSSGGGSCGDTAAKAPPAVDPSKAVAFVEAVSATMLDVQQAWQLEKAEMAQALESAEAVHAQLEALLERERQDNRGMTAEGAEMAAALAGLEARLEAAQAQLAEMDAAQTARAATDAALEACRSELSSATAKAAAAADDAAKWQGTATALEAQLAAASKVADVAQRDAAEAREELAAKDGRIAEMRSAMAAAVDDRSSSSQGVAKQLAAAQAACSSATQPALQHLQAALATVAAEEREPSAAALAAAMQVAAEALRGLPPADRDLAGCVGGLGSAVGQLAAGYAHVAAMLQERHQVHHILSAVTARLQHAAASHPSRLQQALPTPSGASSGGTAAGGGAAASNSGASASLVELLQRLTESVVGLIEGLAVEKECLESQMLHAGDEAAQLRSQLQSTQRVLASMQGETALEHQEALVALEQAHARLAELEEDHAELAQRAERAERTAASVRESASREWGAMRDDLSILVQQAEQAQLNAESTSQRQRAEYETRLAAVQLEAGEAAAAFATAEAAADSLRRELAGVRADLSAAEQRAAAQEAALRGALEASQRGVQELEGQVGALQRQLATRARKGGVSVEAAKKAAAASSAAGQLKKENRALRGQVEGLQGQVRLLEQHVRQGVQQMRQAKEIAEVAQRSIADAEGRASRAEALLRKVDERKAAAEVERRRAAEAAGRLEQQVLELRSRLEAAQHRERAAQDEAERLRAASGKRGAEAAQLCGTLCQLEVAEAALRDSQGTATRLLQDCTNLQRQNRALSDQEHELRLQLQGTHAQQEAAAAADQVADLQATLDSVLTELDIARSLLASQRGSELAALERQGGGDSGLEQLCGDGGGNSGAWPGQQQRQQLIAFPARLGGLEFHPEADAGEQPSVLDQALGHILGPRNTNARGSGSTSNRKAGFGTYASHCTPGAASAWTGGSRPSPLTQARSVTQTPGTPTAAHTSATPGAARMGDDASTSRGVTPEWPAAAAAAAGQAATSDAQQQQCQQQQAAGGRVEVETASRSDSAASSVVDVADVRRLVTTVESLQRQLAVKNERIQQLRAALEQAAAQGASFTPPASRPGSAASGGGSESLVQQQRLEAAQRQVQSLQALGSNLERQLSDAQQAQHAVQAQLAAAAQRLAVALAEHGCGSGGSASRPSSAQGGLPATAADSGSVLRLQAHQFEQLAAQACEALEASQRKALAAEQASSALTLQLGSRNKLVEALQAQLRTHQFGASSGAVEGRSQMGTQTEPCAAFLLAPPAPVSSAAAAAAGPAAADALGSLEKITGYWRQACQAKDVQLEHLRGELEQAQDGLSRAQAELEALGATAQQLAAHQQHSSALAEELQQQLAAAEQQLGASQVEEQALSVRCTELEAALMEAQGTLQVAEAVAEADGAAAQEARQAAVAAEQHAHALQQQLSIAEAQVRELQLEVQLERASHGDAAAARRQLTGLQADLAAAQQEATAAQERAAQLQQRLRQQEGAAAAAAEASVSGLAARLEAAQQAEQRLLRQLQDAQAQLAAAEAERRQAAVREAEAKQLHERLAASEQQRGEALDAVEQQSAALEALQSALERQHQQQDAAVEAAATQGELARQLASTQQQLSLTRQQLEVAQRQAELLRGQAAKAEADTRRAAAAARHVEAREAAVADALQRYQRGVAVLSSTLQQLQGTSGRAGGGDADERLLASLQAGASDGGGDRQAAVEELVDAILMEVHRRDCEVSSLVAQVAHLEAATAGSARQRADAEAKQQQHARSLGRLKESLHWCASETDALKRQLGDRDQQIAALQREARNSASAGGGGSATSSWRSGGR